MNKEVMNYIEDLEQTYGEDWAYYLPVYFHEQRELIEGWGYRVHGFTDPQVGEMFKNLILECIDGPHNDYQADVEIKGVVSTCSIMEWVLMHGCPNLNCTHFKFPDDKNLSGLFAGCPKSMVVSGIRKDNVFCDVPVEEWHEPIKGIRRIMPNPDMRMWYCEISGRYYYITG